MKKFRTWSMAAVLAGCLSFVVGCEARTVGSGKVASETRAVSGFHAVELAATGTLEIMPGDTEGLVVEAEDNLLPLIETKVTANGTLLITFKRGESVETTKGLLFKLSAKTLDAIKLTGSGKIHVAGKLSSDKENIALPGSGSITVDKLEAGALAVSLAGSGTVKVTGGASSQHVELSGSGDYEAEAFKTDAATVSVNGSGVCKVWAEKTLDAKIGGSGAVMYHGNPEVKQRVSGSGTIRALGAKAM